MLNSTKLSKEVDKISGRMSGQRKVSLIKFAISSIPHMSPPYSMIDSFASTEWDSLAHTIKTLKSGVEDQDAGGRKLRAETGIVRMILYDKMRQFNGEETIDLSFFIASFKTIRKMEREFDANQIKKREFLIFLKLLLCKFEKQKLNVKKPLAMLAEFDRMKGAVEDEHTPLR